MATGQLSKKSAVIEDIFLSRWDIKSKSLAKALVTLADVSASIRKVGLTLSDKNPANFFKDFIRKKKSANRNWPASVFAEGYAAVQETGKGNCFRFVAVPKGQLEPFPQDVYPKHPAICSRHEIQSVSLSPFARLLGRSDETWLIQVLVRLDLVQTHFALFSTTNLHHVDHLQTGIKMTNTEIDALFLGETAAGPRGAPLKRVLITLEAKGAKDDILEDQILRQVETALALPAMKKRVTSVVPLAAKVLGKSQIYVAEYKEVSAGRKAPKMLTLVKEVIYTIKPAVEGIR